MNIEITHKLISQYKNFVFIGETGSGKTEIAINLALQMSALHNTVHFFDLDQTKPLFRARDAEKALIDAGIHVHYEEQHLDAPTVAGGVIELLVDPDTIVILDIGGGSHGAHMIGQFSHILNNKQSAILYVVNPYRAWSDTAEHINATISKITKSSRLNKINVVANPNLGPETVVDDVFAGIDKLQEMLGGTPMDFLCVYEELLPQVVGGSNMSLLPIQLKMLPEWL